MSPSHHFVLSCRYSYSRSQNRRALNAHSVVYAFETDAISAAASSALAGDDRSSSQSRTAPRAAAIANDGPRTRSARRKKRRCEAGDEDCRIGGDGGGDDDNKRRRRTTSVIQFYVKAYDRDEDGGYQDRRHFGLIEGMGGGEGQCPRCMCIDDFRSFVVNVTSLPPLNELIEWDHILFARCRVTYTFIHNPRRGEEHGRTISAPPRSHDGASRIGHARKVGGDRRE